MKFLQTAAFVAFVAFAAAALPAGAAPQDAGADAAPAPKTDTPKPIVFPRHRLGESREPGLYDCINLRVNRMGQHDDTKYWFEMKDILPWRSDRGGPDGRTPGDIYRFPDVKSGLTHYVAKDVFEGFMCRGPIKIL